MADWVIEPIENRLRRGDESHHLEPKVMDLLVLLADRSGRTVSKDEIFSRVWEGVAVTDTVLYRAIFQLRKILEENPKQPSLILTTPKRGYRLAAQVEPLDGETLIQDRRFRRSRTTIVAAMLVVLTLGWIISRTDRGVVPRWLFSAGPPAEIATADLRPRRVLVAHFENRTGEPDLDRIDLLAVDWVTRGLARTGLIEVIPSVSAFRLLRATETFGSAAVEVMDRARLIREADVGVVVSGSYRRRHDRIVIHARISEAPTNRVLGAIQPVEMAQDAVLEGLEVLKERVAGSLAAVIDPRISSWSRFASQPPSFKRYRQFIEGLDLFVQGRRDEARTQFLEAGSDGSFPTAYIWAMNAATDDNSFRDSLSRGMLPARDSLLEWDQAMLDYHRADSRGERLKAYRAIRRVVELAPDSEWRHMYAGEALRLNRPGEALDILKSHEPPPRLPWHGPYSHWNSYPGLVATALHLQGEHEAELAHVRRWRRRKPGWGNLQEMFALAALGRTDDVLIKLEEHLAASRWAVNLDVQLYRLGLEVRAHGDPEGAIRVLRWAIGLYEKAPDLPRRTAKARRGYGRLLYAAGDWEAARRVFDRLMRVDRDTASRGDLGLLAGRLGDLQEARRISGWYANWSMRNPLNGGWAAQWRARIAAAAGLEEDAVGLLRQAFDEGWSFTVWDHLQPEYVALKDYPPFQSLMRPKG